MMKSRFIHVRSRPPRRDALTWRAFLALLALAHACGGDGEPRLEVASPVASAVCDADSPSWPGADPELLGLVPDQPLPSFADLEVPDVELIGRHDAALGTTNGAATYAVRLAVPPGRVGLAPTLAFTYSSRGGGNAAGVGWSVTGSPRIHRCPQTVVHDGHVRPVRLDADDRLCLDGERLIL